jgi:hypothetical protein
VFFAEYNLIAPNNSHSCDGQKSSGTMRPPQGHRSAYWVGGDGPFNPLLIHRKIFHEQNYLTPCCSHSRQQPQPLLRKMADPAQARCFAGVPTARQSITLVAWWQRRWLAAVGAQTCNRWHQRHFSGANAPSGPPFAGAINGTLHPWLGNAGAWAYNVRVRVDCIRTAFISTALSYLPQVRCGRLRTR